LTVFETPAGESFDGPALIDARILQNTTVSKAITLLNQGGSSVELGNLLIVPVDGSILYFRPLYLEGRNALPVLTDVIAVYGGQGTSQVYMEPTLTQALSDVFGTTVTLPSQKNVGTGKKPATQPVTSKVKTLVTEIDALYKKAQTALSQENLGAYEADFKQIGVLLAELQAETAKPTSTAPKKPSPTTTTTVPTTTTTTTATTASTSSSTSTTGVSSSAGTRSSSSSTSSTVGSA
jgi:uncharacterized membrane protein (UPF0182 family)